MENLEAADQIALMRQGTEYRFPVTLRGLTVFLRPLSISEVTHVYHQVVVEMNKTPEAARNALMENILIAKKTLEIASTDPENPKKAGQLLPWTLDKMTQDEVSALYDEYVRIVESVNPSLEYMSHEQVQGLVNDLKKNLIQQTDLSFLQLASIVNFYLTKEESPQDK